MNRTLSGITTLGQNGPGGNDNGASPSNLNVMSKTLVGAVEEVSYHSAEMQLVYSIDSADWVINIDIKLQR